MITLLLITFVTTAVYCYCKGCSITPDNRPLDYHRVNYTTVSHHSLHQLPNVQPVSVVAEVTPQVTVDLIENPFQTLQKKTARRKKRQLRTRSASSSADEWPRSSEPFEPQGELDI